MKGVQTIPLLDKYIEENSQNIKKEIQNFLSSENQYRNIQYGPNFCLLLNKSDEPLVIKNIGYPFPIYSKKDNSSPFFVSGVSVKFFLRGEPVRVRQRIDLFNSLCSSKLTRIEEISSLKIFRKAVLEICKKHKKFSYFDPYTFVGDSFIGLYIIENISKTFSLNLNKIYSKAYKHLDFAFDSENYDIKKTKQVSGLAIISDFVDSHWEKTSKTIKKLLKKNVDILVIGRNLLFYNQNGELIVSHLAIQDPLLRNQNIENYMNSCLKPFLNPNTLEFKAKKVKTPNIIINPFGSEKIKTIPKKIIINFILNIKKSYPSSKIILIKGLKEKKSHNQWIRETKKNLKNLKLLKKVEIKAYKSLSEIAKEIIAQDIHFGITADTSISHLLNFLGIVNVSFFNKKRWDPKSVQSLCSDSPLGFCRYGKTQFPAIIKKNNSLLSKALIECFLHLIEEKKNPKTNLLKFIKKIKSGKLNHESALKELEKKNLDWANTLYNPREIIEDIPDGPFGNGIKLSAIRLSPLVKLKEQSK